MYFLIVLETNSIGKKAKLKMFCVVLLKNWFVSCLNEEKMLLITVNLFNKIVIFIVWMVVFVLAWYVKNKTFNLLFC